MSEPMCERLDAFVDGELAPEEREAFAAHLATCAECQREMHDLMMLQALAETHAPARRPAATVVDLAAHRQRRRWFIAAAALVAAAAAMALLM